MTIVESLKKGWSAAFKSMPVVLVLFVFGLAWNLLNIFYTSRFQAETPDVKTSAVLLALSILFILISIYMQAGLMGFVRNLLKQGAAGLADFWAAAGRYYARLLLIGAIVTAALLLFVLVGALVVALVGPNLRALAVTIAVFLGIVALYLLIKVFLAPYVAVVDEKGAIESIKGSAAFVKSNAMAVIGLALLVVVIGFGFGVALGLVFALLSLALQGVAAQVAYAVLSSLLNAFLGVFVTGAFMALYLGHSKSTVV